MSELTTMTVQILGKPYQVSCPSDEVDALSASARYLDSKMVGIKNSGKIIGLDRIAVMAALNIANELISAEATARDSQEATAAHMNNLAHRLDLALARLRQQPEA
ncbi:MAG: cell division protein ZapA [Pseudomonadales bacterium]